MSYYTLAVWLDGQWSPQFGDRDRSVVAFELDDYRDHGTKRSHMRIVKTATCRARDVAAEIAKLNGAPRTVRMTVEKAFDYLTAGETYDVSNPVTVPSRGTFHIRRTDDSSGTFIGDYLMRQALAAGWIVPADAGAAQ